MQSLIQWPPQLDNDNMPTGWVKFSPRKELAPHCSFAETVRRSDCSSLEISGNKDNTCVGGWRTNINHIESESFYAFEIFCQVENVDSIQENVFVALRWQGEFGPEVTPDFVNQAEIQNDGWFRFYKVLQAPKDSDKVQLDLALRWAGNGHVWWSEPSLVKVPKPASRLVKICTTRLQPKGVSPQENINEFLELVDRAAAEKPDIILLTETPNLYHVNEKYQDVAEEIPGGPIARQMANKAKEHGVYLIYCINQRDGNAVYNTSVLLNRQGEIVGKYHKVHIPQEELYGGVSPGDSYTVFETDFGKIGILVCIDTAFPESARELARKGAEIIFAPTWGANSIALQTRAIDNAIYIVNAGFDVPSMIINPLGEVLAQADKDNANEFAYAEIDLSREFRQPWLGNWRDVASIVRSEELHR